MATDGEESHSDPVDDNDCSAMHLESSGQCITGSHLRRHLMLRPILKSHQSIQRPAADDYNDDLILRIG